MSWLLLIGAAAAARPDAGGGLFHFDDTDVLAAVDGEAGLVRVHYSVEGPNQTLLADDDGSGFPDFAEGVAAQAEAVLTLYEATGFLPPVSEADLGLGELGGSPAFDFYLVDFGGSSDGQFSTDRCVDGRCAGYMIIENDFAGYGYGSLDEAIAILTSHELFHAVQAAYNASQPDWMSEGTAVWAEHLYRPENDDFIGFCSAYLQDVGRSLNSPPAGSVTAFSYGTALFWDFLVEVADVDILIELQAQMVGRDADAATAAITDTLAARALDWATLWPQFARWNLASGRRAGLAESYPFAAALRGISAEDAADFISDDNRFYPLAATYYRLEHAGGPIAFATAEDPTGLTFSLHPVADGSDDGPVAEALATWAPDGPGLVDLGAQPAGGYWLVGAYAAPAEQSVKIAFCLGEASAAAACAPAADTGDDTAAPDTSTPDADEDVDGGGKSGESGCAVVAPTSLPALALAFALLVRRRARS